MPAKGGIGVLIATAVGLGAIIGAGIFVLSGTAIAIAGPYALIAFVIVGVVALLVAAQLAELGSIMPYVKGASYSYVHQAFGSELGFITGILLYFMYASAISVVALGFGSYAANIVGLPESYGIYFAIVAIAGLAVVNLIGIKSATRTDSVLVAVKVAILVIFIVFALWLASSNGIDLKSSFASLPSQRGLGPIFAASVVILFAYSGFQVISTFFSKISGGTSAGAKALLLAVGISMTLYILIAIAMVLLVPASKYTVNADPLAFALQHAGAPSYIFELVDVGALIATASATLAMMLSASRIMYQMSADGLLPMVFRSYNKRRDVAGNAVIVSSVIAVAMLFAGNIYTITAISNFGLLFAYLMSALAVLHFRRIRKTGNFRTPFYPYLSIITIIAILLFIYGMPQEALQIGVFIILLCIVVYYSLRELREKKVVKTRLFK